VHKTNMQGCEIWPWKQCFEEHCLELCDFPINYILHCSMCLILSTYQDFFKYCFNNFCFHPLQNVAWTDEIMHVIRHKWGKISPSYLFSNNGDLSYVFYRIFNTVPGREYSREVSKKLFSNFYFWGITLIMSFSWFSKFKLCTCAVVFFVQ